MNNNGRNSDTSFNTTAFMRWAMLTPLIVPLILLLFYLFIKQIHALQAIQRLEFYQYGIFVFYASVIACIPYLVFMLVSWKKLSSMDGTSAIHYVLLSPVIFFLYQCLFLLIVALVAYATNGMHSLLHGLYGVVTISAFVFPVGYAYVALILILYAIVKYLWSAKERGKRYLHLEGDTP